MSTAQAFRTPIRIANLTLVSSKNAPLNLRSENEDIGFAGYHALEFFTLPNSQEDFQTIEMSFGVIQQLLAQLSTLVGGGAAELSLEHFKQLESKAKCNIYLKI